MVSKLTSLLTELDIKLSKAEVKRRSPVNIYRLGHYLAAAEDFRDDLADGKTPRAAFVRNFLPAKDMHKIAITIGLAIDVANGRWIATDTNQEK
jgi:hypothetical protein